MFKTRALFIALEAYLPTGTRASLAPRLSPALIRLVADHRALGYRIVPVASARAFRVETEDDRDELQALVERLFRTSAGVPITAVVVMTSPHDPREIWDAARRYELDVARSILLTESGVHIGVAKTAGLRRTATVAELSSMVVPA